MESWLVIIITLVASAFFSGMEIAFVTSNKLRIELESKQGNFSGKIFSYFNQYPSRYLGAMLLGNNIALVVFGIFMERMLTPLIAPFFDSAISILLIQTLISTILILIAGEFLPKNLFRINPNTTLKFFAIPVWVIYIILYPIVFVTTGFSELILKRVFGAKFIEDRIAFGRIDLDNYVREITSSNKEKEEIEHEIKIFQNALDFSSIKARECMIPRNEIIALEINDSIDELRATFIQTRLSKILIYNGNIDNIIGYTYSHELFKNPESIRAILMPISVVPESMPVNEVLTVFIQQHKSIAVVVDEFGGTSGMLTMEDVIEELFGEIEDEHDKEEMVEKQISENEFIFAGRLEIDYLNDKYALELPISDDYETLSGLIIHYHESIPRLNEEIFIDPFVFKITGVSGTRIEQVYVKLKNEME